MRHLWPLVLVACHASAGPASPRVFLPGGEGGIGFDDLRFSPTLQRVLAPAGRTGKLDLIDPKTHAIESVGGFSSVGTFAGGHGGGTTSVDEGAGVLFAIDRDRRDLVIVDPRAKAITMTARLAGAPDYVRWVESTNEVWVTEPGDKQIEYFTFDGTKLARRGVIGVPGGPESLVIDAKRGRAYTHTWGDATVVIDLARHAELVRWTNGCTSSRGIALDAARGVLFVGCEEGKAITLDVDHDGKQLGAVDTGKGVDIIAFAPTLSHLYVPAADSATLTIVGVDATGALAVLGTTPAPAEAHCVTTDNRGHAFVCDPKHGALLVVDDAYPANRR